MAFSAGGEGRKQLADINITPLVDVMLVLLIIFMVTAPLIQTGVKIDLPRAAAPQLASDEQKLELDIDANRNIFLDKVKIPYDQLKVKLSTNARVQKDKELYIRADRSLPYGIVVDVMAIAQDAGVESLGMITQPGAPEGR